jgi:competence protein ComEC
MPRAGWLAIGATAAALVAAGGAGGLPILALAGGSLVLLAAAIARGLAPAVLVRVTAPFAFAVAGSVAILLRTAAGGGFGPAPEAAIPPGSGPWPTTVVAVGSPRDGQQAAMVQVEMSGQPVVAATLPRYPEIQPGDRVRIDGTIRAPGDDSYGQYLARIGAIGTIRARTMELLEPSNDPSWIVERFRRTAGDALIQAIPEPAAGLAAGILVGLRDRVDRELAAAFTTAGVSHVVAISGWNIAIVAALVASLLRGVSRRRRAILTIAAIGAYVAFAGASPSVLRAAVMAGVVLLAREVGGAGRAAAVLGVAAALLLAVDPRLVLDAGFQLSTVATAGLIAWATPLTERLAGPDPGRVRRRLAESLGVSLAAQAATLPIVLATFGRLSVVAPLVNLLVVPLVPAAMALGMIAMLAGWGVLLGLPAALAVIGGLPAWAILGVMITVVRAGASLPLASVGLEPPWSVLAGAMSAVVIAAFAARRHLRAHVHGLATVARIGGSHRSPAARADATAASRARSAAAGSAVSARTPRRAHNGRWWRVAGIALIGGAGALSLVVSHRPDGVTRIIVLDVGQGDAILIEGAHGGRVLLDSGPDPNVLMVALDERLPPWDRRLDAVVLTHPHEDHVAGAALLIDRYRVGRVYEPGMEGPGPGYAAARAAITRRGVPVATLAAGDHLAIDGAAFEVLWPDRGRVPKRPSDGGTAINNVSIVLLGDIAGRRVLLTGDIEQAIDPVILGRGLGPVDFLKVAHHGSATASTGAFLDAARPAVAVISAGAGNPYGHPAPATVERLKVHGARVLRTDHDGSVEIAIDAYGALTATPERGRGLGGLATATSAGPSAGPLLAAASSQRVSAPAAVLPPFGCSVPVLGLTATAAAPAG